MISAELGLPMTRKLSLTIFALGFLGTAAWLMAWSNPPPLLLRSTVRRSPIGGRSAMRSIETKSPPVGAPANGLTFSDSEQFGLVWRVYRLQLAALL